MDLFFIQQEGIQAQINLSLNTLINLRDNLQKNKQQQLKILVYDKLITPTFQIIDPKEEKSIIQLDHKVYRLPRHYMYGFQIKKTYFMKI